MATRKISTKLQLDGEAEYRASLKNINSELGTLKSELKLTESLRGVVCKGRNPRGYV